MHPGWSWLSPRSTLNNQRPVPHKGSLREDGRCHMFNRKAVAQKALEDLANEEALTFGHQKPAKLSTLAVYSWEFLYASSARCQSKPHAFAQKKGRLEEMPWPHQWDLQAVRKHSLSLSRASSPFWPAGTTRFFWKVAKGHERHFSPQKERFKLDIFRKDPGCMHILQRKRPGHVVGPERMEHGNVS